MNATKNRYSELSPRDQLDIDTLINTLAAHKGIDHPTMRRARKSVRRATREISTACHWEERMQALVRRGIL
jgi:hypothetical protein